MSQDNFVEFFEKSLKSNWELPALSDYKGDGLTYGEVAKKIKKIHILLENGGIERGDKVALMGKNSVNWGVSFLAVVTYGAVIVPILPDFKPKDAHNIITHSDAKVLFVADFIWNTLDIEEMKFIKAVFLLENFSLDFTSNKAFEKAALSIEDLCVKSHPDGFSAANFTLPKIGGNELAEINYTSGTTGFSKGVMLTHKNLVANIRFAQDHMPLESGDNIVSFLPLAHAYGLAFEFLFPFTLGCHITFLTKTPSPQIITKAFQEIRPRLILSVPLVIEKIFKKKIKPQIEKSPVSLMLKVPVVNRLVYKKVLDGLFEGFGGNFREVVIGGAALNEDIERFFKKIGFPFTVGYGMTECGPLIAYASWQEMRIGSCGKIVDHMEVKIDSTDPYNEVGEILVRGDHVMKGYYKNPDATKDSIDEDGWLYTGDLGLIDKDNFIYIKGRSKSMLLGPSGQNIYPEELESMLNNRAYVSESLVIERNGKLVALVYPDFDLIKANNVDERDRDKIFEKYRKQLNENVPAFMQVSRIVIYYDEFVKTPKQSIKRFMYQDVDV
jgi:long-chain acyl-CoA synthetase